MKKSEHATPMITTAMFCATSSMLFLNEIFTPSLSAIWSNSPSAPVSAKAHMVYDFGSGFDTGGNERNGDGLQVLWFGSPVGGGCGNGFGRYGQAGNERKGQTSRRGLSTELRKLPQQAARRYHTVRPSEPARDFWQQAASHPSDNAGASH